MFLSLFDASRTMKPLPDVVRHNEHEHGEKVQALKRSSVRTVGAESSDFIYVCKFDGIIAISSTMFSSGSRTLFLRRTFATAREERAAAAAQALSAPLKVQSKREVQLKDPVTGRYFRQITVRKPPSNDTSVHGRGRIRGVRRVKLPTGETEERIVGQRIYLPNIVVTMVRNHTLPGKPYNPYEATFRVPPSLTKTDIRSYLSTVYGVQCTYIRTDNYLPAEDRKKRRLNPSKSAYKRAVVGLVEPFYYPQAIEDMNGRDRWLREAFLEETFKLQARKRLEKELLVKLTQKSSDSWTLRGNQWMNKKATLKAILKKREEKERRTREAAEMLLKAREEKSAESVVEKNSSS